MKNEQGVLQQAAHLVSCFAQHDFDKYFECFADDAVFIFHTSLKAQNTEEILVGNPNSKVTIKIFSSFTCPHCANFHKNIYSKN